MNIHLILGQWMNAKQMLLEKKRKKKKPYPVIHLSDNSTIFFNIMSISWTLPPLVHSQQTALVHLPKQDTSTNKISAAFLLWHSFLYESSGETTGIIRVVNITKLSCTSGISTGQTDYKLKSIHYLSCSHWLQAISIYFFSFPVSVSLTLRLAQDYLIE